MKRRALLVLLALACGPVAAGDDAATVKLAERCAACHGAGGAKPIAPDYPVIAGQYRSYLEHAMTEYKQGKRKNAVMAAQAAMLSAEEIEALARYFDRQPSPLYTPADQ